MKVLALIPARSQSKSIKDKNIRQLNGKPLLVHSINHAKKSTLINRIIVSTDSEKYRNIAIKNGAEAPFIRPDSISQDMSTDLEVFEHTLKWLIINENYAPDICVHLRPTYPIRNVSDIDKMIKILQDDASIDSVRSITKSEKTPYKMWFFGENSFINPVINLKGHKDAFNLPRQLLPVVYIQNASIDVIRTKTITKLKSMSGKAIKGYNLDNFFDIDHIDDLKKVRRYMKNEKK